MREVNDEPFLKIAKRTYDVGLAFYNSSNRYHDGIAPVNPNRVNYAEKLLSKFLLGVDGKSVVIAAKVRRNGTLAKTVKGFPGNT